MKPRLRNVNRFSSNDKLDQVTRLQAKYVQKHRLSLAWSPHKDSAQQLVYIPPRLELGADPHSSPFCILHATESLWYIAHIDMFSLLCIWQQLPHLCFIARQNIWEGVFFLFFFFVSLERKCPICVSEVKMKWDAPWVLPGAPYLLWVWHQEQILPL